MKRVGRNAFKLRFKFETYTYLNAQCAHSLGVQCSCSTDGDAFKWKVKRKKKLRKKKSIEKISRKAKADGKSLTHTRTESDDVTSFHSMRRRETLVFLSLIETIVQKHTHIQSNARPHNTEQCKTTKETRTTAIAKNSIRNSSSSTSCVTLQREQLCVLYGIAHRTSEESVTSLLYCAQKTMSKKTNRNYNSYRKRMYVKEKEN